MLAGTQSQSKALSSGHVRVHELTSKWPALVEGDMMDYSPSRVARGTWPKETVEDLANYTQTTGNGHGLLALCSHSLELSYTIERRVRVPTHPDSNQPWWKGFYTADTNFNLSQALDNPSSSDYKALLSDGTPV